MAISPNTDSEQGGPRLADATFEELNYWLEEAEDCYVHAREQNHENAQSVYHDRIIRIETELAERTAERFDRDRDDDPGGAMPRQIPDVPP